LRIGCLLNLGGRHALHYWWHLSSVGRELYTPPHLLVRVENFLVCQFVHDALRFLAVELYTYKREHILSRENTFYRSSLQAVELYTYKREHILSRENTFYRSSLQAVELYTYTHIRIYIHVERERERERERRVIHIHTHMHARAHTHTPAYINYTHTHTHLRSVEELDG
jgi:hypothetical protein